MSNYPDDIGDWKCPYCKEITPNCVCSDFDDTDDDEEVDEEYLEQYHE